MNERKPPTRVSTAATRPAFRGAVTPLEIVKPGSEGGERLAVGLRAVTPAMLRGEK